MSRTRDIRWGVRLGTVAGLILIGTLLFGAQSGTAAPPVPVGPTDIAPPTTVTTTTTKPPKPNFDPPTGDFEVEKPCWVTDTCKPPTTDPSEPPADDPSEPATPTDPPTTEPSSIPTPNRIDTGTGGGSAVPGAPTWLFWVIPGLAVLTLAAGVSGYWMARSEQDRR